MPTELLQQSHALSVKEIVSREEWNAFLGRVQPHTFLQSWEYGEFQRALGERIFRLGVYERGVLVACALAFVIRAKRGSILFVPHGPVLDSRNLKLETQRILDVFTEKLRCIAKEHACVCVRISSLLEDLPKHRQLLAELGFRKAPTFVHPERAWILDISPDEQILLSAMRKTTRYSIKKAEKDGVAISSVSDYSGVDSFYSLYTKTVERQHFVPFSKAYIEEECRAFSPDGVRFFFARYQSEVVAAALVIFSGLSAFYHHGASTHHKTPAAYLLQWRAIQEAKRRGCRWYNFWGIAPDDAPAHPWAGLTLFKKGFGGYAESYVSAQDFILSPQYVATYLIEWLRRKKRRL